MFIVFDGVDGSGKTSISQDILRVLELTQPERRFELHRHPGATDFGVELRKLLKSPKYKPVKLAERLIFFADWVQFTEEKLRPALKENTVVLNDRATPITDIVYGLAGGVPLYFFEKLYAVYAPPQIDLLIVLRISPHASFERRAKRYAEGYGEHQRCRIEEQEGGEFLARVSQLYDQITSDAPHTALIRKYAKRIVVVDGEKSISATQLEALNAINECLKSEKKDGSQ